MTASTFLRVGVVVLLAIGAVLGAWLRPAGASWAWIAVGALLWPLAGYALSLGIQVAVGAIVDPRSPPMPAHRLLALWLAEWRVAVATMLWRIPFATRPLATPRHDPSRPAVLRIHGYMCSHAVWQPMLDARTFDGCGVDAVDLPLFSDIDDYAEVVRTGVDRLLAATGAAQAILVCHSMGGLAARAYLRRFGDARVSRIVTISTPHHGTIFGALGAGPNAKQMAHGSVWLAQLAADTTPAVLAKLVCIATPDDNLIVPRASTALGGARSRPVEGIGHLEAIDVEPVRRIVREEIGLAAQNP